MQSTAPFSLIGGAAHFMFSALLPRSSSGQDAALSRLKQEFDSPTGRHFLSISLIFNAFSSGGTEGGTRRSPGIMPFDIFAAALTAILF